MHPPTSPPLSPLGEPPSSHCNTDIQSLVIGIVIHVLGSIGINTGQNLQAMALSQLSEASKHKPWRSRRWTIGCALFVSCSILNFVALTLAPASILVPLESVQFVNNVIFGLVVRKIAIPLRMWCGVACMILGTLSVVLFGAPCAPHFSAEHLEQLWTWSIGWAWWTFICFSFCISAFSLYLHSWYGAAVKRGEVSEPSGAGGDAHIPPPCTAAHIPPPCTAAHTAASRPRPPAARSVHASGSTPCRWPLRCPPRCSEERR